MSSVSSGLRPTALLREGFSFLKRQERDWKITVLRTSLDKLAYQMIFPYLSVYIVALGATGVQLGVANSIGMIVAGVVAPFIGWLIDRKGPKKIYLAGIALLAVSYLTYGLAQRWEFTILAMMAYWGGLSVSGHSCATICGNCLANRDRATGMMICETVAAGLLGMAGPILATGLVTQFGGVNAGGIRPLFYAGFLITAGAFLLVLTKLSGRTWTSATDQAPHLLKDIAHVLQGGRQRKKWLILSAVSHVPLGMVFPFTQVFAYAVKGADAVTLGAMVTGSALSSILFAIPLGRLADRIGRKQVLYITIPLFWISNLVLVFAPSSVWLMVAGMLQGFYYIGAPVASAMERELVPPRQMGRWLGINRFVKMMASSLMAMAAGFIWDGYGPQAVFLVYVGLDFLIRMPLLISLPETLHKRFS